MPRDSWSERLILDDLGEISEDEENANRRDLNSDLACDGRRGANERGRLEPLKNADPSPGPPKNADTLPGPPDNADPSPGPPKNTDPSPDPSKRGKTWIEMRKGRSGTAYKVANNIEAEEKIVFAGASLQGPRRKLTGLFQNKADRHMSRAPS